MDANVVLIEIMLCCQIIAPYIAHAHKIDSPDGKISPTFSPLFREIVTNSSFVMAGGCLAINFAGNRLFYFESHEHS